MNDLDDDDDLSIEDRSGAELVNGVSTSADSSHGEGLAVELWKWNGEYFLKSSERSPEAEIILGGSVTLTDWHDLGAVSLKKARNAMDDLLSELAGDESP